MLHGETESPSVEHVECAGETERRNSTISGATTHQRGQATEGRNKPRIGADWASGRCQNTAEKVNNSNKLGSRHTNMQQPRQKKKKSESTNKQNKVGQQNPASRHTNAEVAERRSGRVPQTSELPTQ